MTYQPDFNVPSEILEQVASEGLEALPELIRIVVNAAMQAERRQYLAVEPYQRSADVKGGIDIDEVDLARKFGEEGGENVFLVAPHETVALFGVAAR